MSDPSLKNKPGSNKKNDAVVDPLHIYKQKRDFSRTPEPKEGGKGEGKGLQFVVQKHWASKLHYDLRLELEGTMKSWAVPKGPSYDPADKRMAIQVEDHPISYNNFEGQIPAKQYGAGKVIIWDRGTWTPIGDPLEGYRKGKIKFELRGHKLQGRWTLIRINNQRSEKKPAWLFIKERDGLERLTSCFSVVDELPDSVTTLHLTGVDLPILAPNLVQHTELPLTLSPQLATLVDALPQDVNEWLWELKFDGYRLNVRILQGEVRLFMRNGNDWTQKMPTLVEALKKLPLKLGWLDGEVVALGKNGLPDFQLLQNAFTTRSTQELIYYVFDMPFAHGHDLRSLPLRKRREFLRKELEGSQSSCLCFSESFEVNASELIESACHLGFEGIIGKRKDSAYTSRRSTDWIKLKCGHRQEFVIAGYTKPKGTRTGLGALIIGVHDASGRLHYSGKVGTGFKQSTLNNLRRKLNLLTTDKCPLIDKPNLQDQYQWVRPELVAEVSFQEWTNDGMLRHPVFHGLRLDKNPLNIIRENSIPLSYKNFDKKNHQTPFNITNSERIIDSSAGIKKIDLIRYYQAVSPLIIEHLKDRPVAFLRAPQGISEDKFFQKHADVGEIQGIINLDEALDSGHAPLMEIRKSLGLLSAAQMNVIEFHTWNARKDLIQRPDRMTFDLDPGKGVAWEQIQEAAQLLHIFLSDLGLHSFLKTSGGKGLHVVVPIKRLYNWATVKGFSQSIVAHLAKNIPQRFVAKSGPTNRVGKIFIDYLRNGFGATTACAWTARARDGMGVSVPVGWNELNKLSGGGHWSIVSIEERLAYGNSPWKEYESSSVALTNSMKLIGFLPNKN